MSKAKSNSSFSDNKGIKSERKHFTYILPKYGKQLLKLVKLVVCQSSRLLENLNEGLK